MNAAANNEIDSDSKIICLVTGSGFKDAASVDKMNADADCPLIGVDEIA